LSDDLQRELALERELQNARKETSRLNGFAPNPQQWNFCSAGGGNSKIHEVLLSGPNQAGGKTYTLQYLITVHATGLYPPEWEGPRFTSPPHLAIACETASTTRDQIYFGTENDEACLFGKSGWMPESVYSKEDLVSLRSHTYGDILDYAKIDWRDPEGKVQGKSTIRFFGYSKGWRKLQGLKLDGIFLNEMPPDDVYNEMRARINKTMGYIWIAACPLGGETETYLMFEKDQSGYLSLITYTIDECTHLTQAEYDFIIGRWKDHPEAEARLYGRPCRGAGMVYGYQRREIVEPPFRASPHAPQVIGLDLPHGTGVFAAVKLVHEEGPDVLHVIDEYKASNQDTPVYIERVKIMGGTRIPVAWPHDGGVGFASTTSGGTIAEKYKSMGLKMMKTSAFVYDNENKQSRKILNAVEMLQDRFATGRLKISQNCKGLLEEIRLYRHDKGKIKANQNDHLIDALHKAVMMLRYAKPESDQITSRFDVYRNSKTEHNFFE